MVQIPTVEQVAAILARAPTDQPWRFEAPARHLIRAALCRAGWKWWSADRRAFVLVARARMRNGVRQPTGWDNIYDPHSWVIFSCCPICDRPFHARQVEHLYCSTACRTRADIIRKHEKIDPRRLRCANCDELLVDPGPTRMYCSAECGWRAQQARARAEGRPTINYSHRKAKREQVARESENPRICIRHGCEQALPPGAHKLKRFCSAECKRLVDNLNLTRKAKRAAKRAAKANGHLNGSTPNGHAADARPNGTGSSGGARPDQDRVAVGALRASRDDATPARAGSAA